jgi:hypothetical protein
MMRDRVPAAYVRDPREREREREGRIGDLQRRLWSLYNDIRSQSLSLSLSLPPP